MATLGWRNLRELLRESALQWWNDNCLRLGASLSYYTLFSLAPLLLIAIAISALVFGDRIASGEVLERIATVVGEDAAQTIGDMVARASQPSAGIAATLSGLVMTAIGASSVFGELQQSLNDIWRAPPRTDAGLRSVVFARIRTFLMIVVVGALLLLSLAVGALVAGFSGQIAGWFPGAALLARACDLVVSLALTTLLFALLFKTLPDLRLRWSDVWLGALFTSALFALGRLGIAYYLGRASTTSIYGPAASIAVILMWVYYSAQLFFFGAEFTHAYARRYGSLRAAAPDPAT